MGSRASGRAGSGGRSRPFVLLANLLLVAGAGLLIGPAAHFVTGVRAQAAASRGASPPIVQGPSVLPGEAVGRSRDRPSRPRPGGFRGRLGNHAPQGARTPPGHRVSGSGVGARELRDRGASRLLLPPPRACPRGRRRPVPLGNRGPQLSADEPAHRSPGGRRGDGAHVARAPDADHLLPLRLDRLRALPPRLGGFPAALVDRFRRHGPRGGPSNSRTTSRSPLSSRSALLPPSASGAASVARRPRTAR